MADFNLNVSLLFVNLHDLRQDEMEQKEAEKLSKSKNEVGTHSSLVCNKNDQILLRVADGVRRQNLDKNELKGRLVPVMVAMVGPSCQGEFSCF